MEFVHNGFKVGPNYRRPPAPLAPAWIDAGNPKVKSAPADYGAWWAAFDDPVLNDLVRTAYAQNVDLRVAGTRVLEARAQRAIAVGTLFPQQQTATGAFQYVLGQRNFTDVKTSFNASWEVDFWGRFRRTIESAEDAVEASVDDYDNVMVTLIADVATAYVQYRIFEQQIAYTQESIRIQRDSLRIATARWKAGQTSQLGVAQASSLLEQLEATVPVLESELRQANNQLCVLLGMPPTELAARLGPRDPIIPRSPPEVVVGIPADLIRRRPDLRSAERLIAAQNAQIGVAEADWYPSFFLNGTIGFEAMNFSGLLGSRTSTTGAFGPAFQWNILNYGRILNNVRLQDFKTQELVGVYQQKVLAAAREVENGIVSFLNSQRAARSLAASAQDAALTVKLATDNFRAGTIDYTPVFVAQQFLVQQQNAYAQAQGDIALGLIAVYRAVGGGWELRLAEQAARAGAFPAPCGPAVEVLPPRRISPPGQMNSASAGQPAGEDRGAWAEGRGQPGVLPRRARANPTRVHSPTEERGHEKCFPRARVPPWGPGRLCAGPGAGAGASPGRPNRHRGAGVCGTLRRVEGLPLDARLLPALRLSRRLLSKPVPAAVLAALPAVLPVRAGGRVRTPSVRRRGKREVDVVVHPHPPGLARGPVVSTLSSELRADSPGAGRGRDGPSRHQ